MNYSEAVKKANSIWTCADVGFKDATGWGEGWLVACAGRIVGFMANTGEVYEFNQATGWKPLTLTMHEEYEQAAIRG